MRFKRSSIENLKKSLFVDNQLFDKCIIHATTFVNAVSTIEQEFYLTLPAERSNLVSCHKKSDQPFIQPVCLVVTVTDEQFVDAQWQASLRATLDTNNVLPGMFVVIVIETDLYVIPDIQHNVLIDRDIWIITCKKTPILNVDDTLKVERCRLPNHSTGDTLFTLAKSSFF